MDDLPDTALVEAALRGHTDAFCALVRRYQDFAYGVAMGKVSDFDLARDVVQEAFLSAYRDLSKLRDRDRFPGWLHGIVRNTSHRALRQIESVHRVTTALCHTAERLAPSPEESVEQAERCSAVRRALAGLGENQREAVSLYYVDGFSYMDIAGMLGVTKATVKGRIQRGRAQLREELTMVQETFKEQELPEDFAGEIRRMLEHAAPRGEERERVIQRIVQIGGPAIEPLCQALDDPIHTVRLLAARGLCAIGDSRALGPMLDRADAWGEVFKTGRVLAIEGMRDALLEIVRGQRPGDLCAALAALAHAEGDGDVYESIVAVFRSTDPAVALARRFALAALCRLRPGEAAEHLAEALRSGDVHLRNQAAWQAEFHGIAPALDACLTALGKDCVRAGALALGHGEPGRRALEEVMRTGSHGQRVAAAMALARVRSEGAFDVLREELLSAAQGTKWHQSVSHTLARCYRDNLAAWVAAEGQRLSGDSAVAWALARSRPAEELPAVEELFREGTPAVREAALRILARQRKGEFIPELRRCLREGRPKKVACEAFQQMRRMSEAALPTVLEMFESEHWAERKSATLLLKYWGKLTREQHDRAKGDPHVAVRDAARLPSESPQCREWARWHPKWHKRLAKTKLAP